VGGGSAQQKNMIGVALEEVEEATLAAAQLSNL
jgi:hypothetical protein